MNRRFTTRGRFQIAILLCILIFCSSHTKGQESHISRIYSVTGAGVEPIAQLNGVISMLDLKPLVQKHSVNSKSTQTAIVLPIYISNFNVIHERDCSASLHWKTNTELGISEFFIEHSTDGIRFNVIHSFQSEGKAEGDSYSYTYPYAANGANFFRIRTKDIMRDSNYGPTIRVLVSCFEPTVQVYPNPTRSSINIRGVSPGQKLELSNMFGKTLRNQIITNDDARIDLDDLQTGIYLLIIANERGEQLIRTRINKQ